jgi:RNA polymerase sigma factor (sigma-70 family)
MDQKLFNNHLTLAYKFANKFSKKYTQYNDDILSAALVGLWTATKEKDKAEITFKKFAGGTIKFHILNEISKLNQFPDKLQRKIKKGDVDIEMLSLDCEDESDINILNTLSSNESIEDLYLKMECNNIINRTIKKLSKEKQTIVTEHFSNDKSFTDIGKDLGLSRSRIHQKKNQAIEELKKELEEKLYA